MLDKVLIAVAASVNPNHQLANTVELTAGDIFKGISEDIPGLVPAGKNNRPGNNNEKLTNANGYTCKIYEPTQAEIDTIATIVNGGMQNPIYFTVILDAPNGISIGLVETDILGNGEKVIDSNYTGPGVRLMVAVPSSGPGDNGSFSISFEDDNGGTGQFGFQKENGNQVKDFYHDAIGTQSPLGNLAETTGNVNVGIVSCNFTGDGREIETSDLDSTGLPTDITILDENGTPVAFTRNGNILKLDYSPDREGKNYTVNFTTANNSIVASSVNHNVHLTTAPKMFDILRLDDNTVTIPDTTPGDITTLRLTNSSHGSTNATEAVYTLTPTAGGTTLTFPVPASLASADVDIPNSSAPITYDVVVEIGGCDKYLGQISTNPTVITNTQDSVEKERLSISVYPNPASERIFINTDKIPVSNKITGISITNLQGQEVFTDEIYDNGYDINHNGLGIGNLKSGMYILTLQTKQGPIEKRISVL